MSACSAVCGWCGRCTAAWEREADDYEPPPDPVSVRVCTPEGEPRMFIGCQADNYALGILTITAIDTGFEHHFTADEWLEAVCYDERGNVLYVILNHLPAARERALQVTSERP